MEKRTLEQPQRVKRQRVETKDGLTRCNKCQEYKSLEEFHKNCRNPNGRQSKCKQCTKRMQAERAILAQPTKKVQKVKTRDGKTRCTACHEYKSIEQFTKNVQRQNGHHSQCSQCYNQKQRAAAKLPYRFAQNMVRNAHRRFKTEKPSDITTDYILELWEKNNCWCAVSHHPTEMRPHTTWTASIERIDDDGGYTKDNVTIVAQRFNVPAKWTREKFLQVPIKAKEVVDLDALEKKINQARSSEQKGRNTRQFRGPDAAGQWLCRGDCGSWKSKEEFWIKPRTQGRPYVYCKKCDSEKKRRDRDTLRGFLMKSLYNCNARTEKRNKLGRPMEFALTLDYLLDLILKQKGRCYLCGIPLVFKPNSEWKCSIERIDNSKGYVPGNVCLICAEFQSADSSQRKDVNQAEVEGTQQWTRETVIECWPELAAILVEQ